MVAQEGMSCHAEDVPKNTTPIRAGYFVDTHCHLDQPPLADEVEAILARARAVGVRRCVTIGTTVDASRSTVALARRYPDMLRAAVGIHPHEADTVTETMLADIESLVQDPTVVAIGEVGLDAYRQPRHWATASGHGPHGSATPSGGRDVAPIEAGGEGTVGSARGAPHALPANQERVLEWFVALAQRRGLPLLIHCRDAYDPLLALLRRCATTPLRGVIHCASGPPAFIREALAVGLHVSFAGNVTFPKAQPLRDLVPLVPDERLLVETDAPFLAPQPVRGKTNEPAFVAHTAACVASLRGMTVEALGVLTSRNARALFGWPVDAAARSSAASKDHDKQS